MEPSRARADPVRFGAFEVDVEAGELRKNGLKVPLQEQPFRVLTLLLENPGKSSPAKNCSRGSGRPTPSSSLTAA